MPQRATPFFSFAIAASVLAGAACTASHNKAALVEATRSNVSDPFLLEMTKVAISTDYQAHEQYDQLPFSKIMMHSDGTFDAKNAVDGNRPIAQGVFSRLDTNAQSSNTRTVEFRPGFPVNGIDSRLIYNIEKNADGTWTFTTGGKSAVYEEAKPAAALPYDVFMTTFYTLSLTTDDNITSYSEEYPYSLIKFRDDGTYLAKLWSRSGWTATGTWERTDKGLIPQNLLMHTYKLSPDSKRLNDQSQHEYDVTEIYTDDGVRWSFQAHNSLDSVVYAASYN